MSTPALNSVTTTMIPLTGDPFVDSLISGSRWGSEQTGTSLTYSFPTSPNVWASQYSELGEPSAFQPFGLSHSKGARAALEAWSRYANLFFTETSDNASNVGDIRFASPPWTRRNRQRMPIFRALAPPVATYGWKLAALTFLDPENQVHSSFSMKSVMRWD